MNWAVDMELLLWPPARILLGRWPLPGRKISLKRCLLCQNLCLWGQNWIRGRMYLIPATKPTHFAYGVTVLSQSVAISRTIVVVTQIHPQKTQTRVICKELMFFLKKMQLWQRRWKSAYQPWGSKSWCEAGRRTPVQCEASLQREIGGNGQLVVKVLANARKASRSSLSSRSQ